MSRPTTLGELVASGWTSVPVAEELRRNAIERIRNGESLVAEVLGYEDTVLPQLENALLAGHDVIFLGERGQAKTRMIRSLTDLLDEWMPIVAGSEINDDPLNPVSAHARSLVAEKGDDTPIDWVHRDERYGEKLATPDTRRLPTSLAKSIQSRSPRAGTSATSSRCTTAWSLEPTVAFLR